MAEAHLMPGDIRSAPVGTITDSGDEIILEEGGASVWLEIRVGDWDPDDTGVKLLAWEAILDSSGFSSGMEGVLTLKSPQCESDTDCEAALGPGTSGVGPPFLCFLPIGAPTPANCTPGFLDTSRSDYITPGLINLVKTTNWAFGGADLAGIDDPEPFPARGFYAGTIVLEVPPNAKGTFAIDLKSVNFIDQNMEIIPMEVTGPAKITVPITGACCVSGICTEGVPESACASDKWFKDTSCESPDIAALCQEQVISTVARVGIIAMPLLLLVGAMVYFGRRWTRAEGA